jgi:putative two-component system response regulator
MASRKTIMLVDDSIMIRASCKFALVRTYDIVECQSAEEMLEKLKTTLPNIILLDVEMPGMSGYDAIKILKEDVKNKNIPVIFLTGLGEENNELLGLSLGAVDYLTKPVNTKLLVKRVETHLLLEDQKNELLDYNNKLESKVKEQVEKIHNLQTSILDIMSQLVEYRDDITGGHIVRTQTYVEILLSKLFVEGVYFDIIKEWNLDYIVPSCQLHDLGKIAIADEILNKPGKLTPEEFEIMKTHTTIGASIINNVITTSNCDLDFFVHAKEFALTHHEKWNGTGYPNRLKENDIPLQGRLMAIADVYDALVSKRPYKDAFSLDEAAKIIIDGKGTHFDPILVDIFISVIPQFEEIAKGK